MSPTRTTRRIEASTRDDNPARITRKVLLSRKRSENEKISKYEKSGKVQNIAEFAYNKII